MLIMPGLGRYPCESCRYVASSRRMLARHFALVHSKKVFKCPLCPFITRYAANWYRHKRDLHGLTKFTSCEVCGFFANSTEELAEHKENEHPEVLQLQKYQDKYHKEKERLSVKSQNPIDGAFLVQVKQEPPDVENQDGEEQFFEEQHNDGTLTPKAGISNYLYEGSTALSGESVQFSLPPNGNLVESDHHLKHQVESVPSNNKVKMNYLDPNTNSVIQMSPLKVRRSYNCESCGLLTTNPREFLYHQRDVHKEKMNIHECKFCIYASKHIQKLQRHCDLVHRGQARQGDGQKAAKNVKPKAEKNPPSAPVTSAPLLEPIPGYNFQGTDYPSNFQSSKPVKKKQSPDILHCSACSYQTRNKMLLIHHEKTMHMKKKFYRCPQCGYVTNEKARFTKHIKYHNLPKMKCEFCHFKTAYKWNMDRHMKNHEMGAAGEYNCLLCSFITKSKQSLKLHVTKHHEQSLVDDSEDRDEDEEIEVVECEESEFNANQLGWNESLQDQSFEPSENEGGMDANSINYPPGDPNSDTVWKHGKLFKKELKCQSCDFATSWPFELKKHEEMHRSAKKHSCPLCGMRFEHVAWLSKHLCRVHKDSSQALDMAAALEVLKPNRRAPQPSQEQVNASFQSIIQQTELMNSPEPSLLSTLLNQSSVSPVSKSPDTYLPYSGSQNSSPRNSEPQEAYLGYSSVPVVKKPPQIQPPKPKVKFPAGKRSCNLCNYKTRWSSELEKHMRTHSDHKPFPCSRCDFRSKWKGDLNRHMMKYHGIKIKTKNHMVPKLKLKKALSSKPNSGSSWQTVSQENTSGTSSGGKSGGKDQESPLDLTVGRGTFLGSSDALLIHSDEDLDLMDLALENIDPIPPGNNYSLSEQMSDMPNSDSHLPMNSDALNSEGFNVPSDELPTGYKVKKKYQCPFCTFNTGTPSRFHVHIVQHYNKRPFMCSECGLRSNWEWDITKHIRLKACKEKTHQNACVLLTDETGRRNYEKYDKYLTDVPVVKKSSSEPRIPDEPTLEPINTLGNVAQFNVTKTYAQKKPIIEGTNVEGAPVNIVVTPDIDMSFSQEAQDLPDGFPPSSLEPINKDDVNSADKRIGVKSFYCKHCNYKNTSRKVVISHLTVHAGTRPFSCRVCGMSSNWRQVVVKHVKTAHNGYMSDVEERLKFVQEGHGIRLTSVTTNGTCKRIPPPTPRDKDQFGCKLCPYKCDKEFYIKFHMKQHKPREGANYKCAFCPYYVKFKKTLVRHMKLHSDPPQSPEEETPSFTGSLPSRPFFAPESDNSHRTQNYAKDNSMSFNSSGQSPMTSVNDMPDSMVSDTDDSIPVAFEKLQATAASIYDPGTKIKRHICKHCPYRTDNKTQFLYHKQFHRPNATAPYRCSLCSYWATMQHLITQHMKIHRAVGESPKVTTTFQLASSTPKPSEEEDAASPGGNIRTVYVQRGDFVEKMFKCNFCPMMNKKRANVKVHQKNHLQSMEDGKFACNMCNYKCLSQGGLTNHMKMHVTMENTCEVPMPNKDGSELQALSKDIDASITSGNFASEGGVDIISKKKVFSYLCMRCPAVFKSSQDLQVHKSFHGSSLAFSCPHCDYRAKHKPHLFKHLQVHSPDYLIKRGITRPPPIDSEKENSLELDAGEKLSDIDPLLLAEATEVRNYMRKSRRTGKKLHRCDLCPAAFLDVTTLSFHTSLHGSNGEFGCSECNYSTVRSANLSLHAQLHSRVLPSGQHVRVFRCPRCPATFQKRSRYDNHLNLHGKNYKYACDRCDYSVRFAANLTKHKVMHNLKAGITTPVAGGSSEVSSNVHPEGYEQRTVQLSNKYLREVTRNVESDKAYVCDRCPYYQPRKDAVLSHMRRHSANDRCKCPYCDYSTSQSFFLRDHVKTHLQPSPLYAPEAFMSCRSFQIYEVEGDQRTLIFEDKGPKIRLSQRFYPSYPYKPEVDDEDTDVSEVSYTGAEAEDKVVEDREDSRPAKVQKTEKNKVSSLNNNSEVAGHVKQKKSLTECKKEVKVTLIDVVKHQEAACKAASSSDVLLISKFLKKNKKLKQQSHKNAKKQLKINSYKTFPSSFSVKNLKSKEDKLWNKKAKRSDDSKKSSIVVKIKVDNASEKASSEVMAQEDAALSEDENCSDAASDVTIPADDFMEDCSMEDDDSFSNSGAPPSSSASENFKNEDLSISSIISNCSSIKLNKCSVTVEMLKLDGTTQNIKTKQIHSDNSTQDGFCSLDKKSTTGSLSPAETNKIVVDELKVSHASDIDDRNLVSASGKSHDLMKVNQCSVAVKPLEVNQLCGATEVYADAVINIPAYSSKRHSSDRELINAVKVMESEMSEHKVTEIDNDDNIFHTSSIYSAPPFANPFKEGADSLIPFEPHGMVPQASDHLIEPVESEGCCLKIESVQTISGTSPFNGSQKWSEDQDAVSHLVMNHSHGDDMETRNEADIFLGHPSHISVAPALGVNYNNSTFDSRKPICISEYSTPINSSQQCPPALKIVEVVGGNAFPLNDRSEKLGCTVDGVVSEMNPCKDFQLTGSSSQIGVLPEHWTKVNSSHDFNSVMATDAVLNGCLSSLQGESEIPLEVLL